MIGYGTSASAPNDIIASAYYDGTGTEVVNLTDVSTTATATATPQLSMDNTPDIILGNTTGAGICTTCNPLSDYILAIAYIHSNVVYVDFFDIFDDGLGTLTSTYLSSMSPVIGVPYIPHTVHLDVIAQASNTLLTNFPFCDNFMITWDDFRNVVHPNVYAAEGNLNMGTIGTPSRMNPITAWGNTPDVAGVQRTGGPDDVALIAYLDATGDKVMFTTWDVTASSTPATLVLNRGPVTFGSPRIDAWDDWNYNDPTNTYSVYKVVAQADTSITIGLTTYTPSVVKTYDNVMNAAAADYTSSDVIDIHSLPGYSSFDPTVVPYSNFAPTVAFGVLQNFEVMHYMEYPQGYAPEDAVFLEPLSIHDPKATLGPSYYWVNSLSSGGSPFPTDAYSTYASAVSASCNEIQPNVNSVYAWAFLNHSINAYEVDYKAPTLSYSFRQAPTVVNNVTEQGWQLYPNPANNQLVVSQAAGSAATTYSVIDMAGRTVAQGILNTGKTDIDVRALAAGTYVLQVNKGDGNAGQAMFVKE